ncbi:MAG: hypothetical protein JWN04_6374 [Myxococcaceae bacterium]|nr:hypothetical protein [Myxococcaceae bacterium]
MTGLKNILLATDFSDASDVALATAFELARALDATVHLLHVLALQDGTVAASLSHEDRAAREKRSEIKLQALARSCEGAGRVGRVITRFGDPARLVLLTAEELPADMIVLGTHSRRGVEHWLLGSVAETVVRQAKCPVLVAKDPPLARRDGPLAGS